MSTTVIQTGAGGGLQPGALDFGVPGGGSGLLPGVGTVLTAVGTTIGERLLSNLRPGEQGPVQTSSNGTCPPTDRRFKLDCFGQLVEVKKRRRRRRLLSCGDKADIAFITGTLGKGSLAGTAISSLLARCG